MAVKLGGRGLGDFSGGQAFGAGLHQAAKNSQAGGLGEGRKGGDSRCGFHISNYMEMMTECTEIFRLRAPGPAVLGFLSTLL